MAGLPAGGRVAGCPDRAPRGAARVPAGAASLERDRALPVRAASWRDARATPEWLRAG